MIRSVDRLAASSRPPRPPPRRRSRSPAARSRSATAPSRSQAATVVIRNGRIVAAGANVGDSRRARRSIDARGKWVTPGIVAGFSRIGLIEVDLAVDGTTDDKANGGAVQRRDRRRSGDQPERARRSRSTAPTA